MFVYISTFKKKDKHQTSGIEIFKKFKSYHKKEKPQSNSVNMTIGILDIINPAFNSNGTSSIWVQN